MDRHFTADGFDRCRMMARRDGYEGVRIFRIDVWAGVHNARQVVLRPHINSDLRETTDIGLCAPTEKLDPMTTTLFSGALLELGLDSGGNTVP